MPKKLLLALIALLFVACQQPKTNTQVIKETKLSSAQQEKVAKAFEEADALQAKHSKWFERSEKLPLTIIATAYIDPETTKTKEYKSYIKLLKAISKDTSLLGNELASKYSSITFVDYNSNQDAKEKFTASYNNRYSDKDKLTDILRPDVEKSSQELLIRLNFKELKKGNLTIEGYKTVKQSHMPRNSYYYTLRKSDYSKLNKKEKNEAIINSIKATLQLSIPEYTPIDRNHFIKNAKVYRFITPNTENRYKGSVYFHESGGKIGKLERELNILKKKKLQEKKQVKTFEGHSDDILDLATMHDYNYIVSASKDKTLRLWDINTGELIKVFKGHNYQVNTLDISTNGTYMVSGEGEFAGDKNYIKLWNMKTGALVKDFILEGGIVLSLKITQDSNYIISGDSLGRVIVWEIASGRKVHLIKAHDNWIHSIALYENDKLISVANQEIKLWDIKTGNLVKTFASNIKVSKVKVSQNVHYLFSTQKYTTSFDNQYKTTQWSIETGKIIKTFKGNLLDVLESGKEIFVIDKEIKSGDRSLKIIDIATGETLAEYPIDNRYALMCAISSPNKLYAFYGTKEEKITVLGLPFTKDDKKNLEEILPAKIKKLKSYESYREDITKQNILTTPLTQKDIQILKYSNYIHIDTMLLNIKSINTIASCLNYTFIDPVISMIFKDTYAKRVGTKVIKIREAYQFSAKEIYNLDEVLFTSAYSYEDGGYKILYEQDDIKNVLDAYEIIDKEY